MKKSFNKEVPKYRIDFQPNQRKDIAIVIPVINEGERIQNLVRRMFKLNIHEMADIVIVDGGSKDGSLEAGFLQSHGVTTLITKEDKGKLSAQLRCAYSFCMDHNYQGVVTIDGNDKDDPKDIPKFINLLNSGYDFVQASRYLPGGYAENTPLIRSLAIKFIHAPLLSISSGFKWTDTTQGFRAYSSKLLKSEKVNIYRNVFSDYELLAYLSHIAPKLGFKCIETGTSRIYPQGEVPTKISSFRGNLKVFITLWDTIHGKFDI